jgi:hypothetical protein
MPKSRIAREKFEWLSLYGQAIDIKNRLPGFSARVAKGKLTVVGRVQPNELSKTYKIQIEYVLRSRPRTEVISPKLTKRGGLPIPHMYEQKRLCLFTPWHHDWRPGSRISSTIVPWASLWLYYYELWHATGEWLGGGHQPGDPAPTDGDDWDE